MLIENRTISRKTPLDGKLEITKRAAERLMKFGERIRVDVGGRHATVALSTYDCTCRGTDKPHVHYFIESPVFKKLEPGSEVRLDWDEENETLAVAPA
jgi:hypothetical protein